METINIFYVDDDEDDLHIFKEALNRIQIPHLLKLFTSGNELLKELKKVNYACDVVFTDLNMPVYDGMEILRSLQHPILKEGLRVVVLSTSSELNDIRRSYELNAVLFIQKSNNFTKFTNLLKIVLRDKLYLRLPENQESFIFRPKSLA